MHAVCATAFDRNFGQMREQRAYRGNSMSIVRNQRQIAMQHMLRLITYNRKDFDDVPGLDVQVLTHAAGIS